MLADVRESDVIQFKMGALEMHGLVDGPPVAGFVEVRYKMNSNSNALELVTIPLQEVITVVGDEESFPREYWLDRDRADKERFL